MLTAGIFGTSLKDDELRVPIFPEHLPWISPEVRSNMVFESNYGERFGCPDEYFLQFGCRIESRERLFKSADVMVLPKPTVEDLNLMRKGQVLWGWPHCVQQRGITQAAIDRELTVIAWEAMNSWGPLGERLMHIFYKNNELAGYSAVHHALQLRGIDGFYGPRRFVVLLGYGAVARGVIHALQSRGFNNILVLTRRPVHLVGEQHPDVYFSSLISSNNNLLVRGYDGVESPLLDVLSKADIICNCILQDPTEPLMYLGDGDVDSLKSNSVIVDVSCDEGMGFPFARPTSFSHPMFVVGKNIAYYSVDHTPSYLWSAASREISRAVIPYLPEVLLGPQNWAASQELSRAVEIDHGFVKNNKILKFQGRNNNYPHQFFDSH